MFFLLVASPKVDASQQQVRKKKRERVFSRFCFLFVSIACCLLVSLLDCWSVRGFASLFVAWLSSLHLSFDIFSWLSSQLLALIFV